MPEEAKRPKPRSFREGLEDILRWRKEIRKETGLSGKSLGERLLAAADEMPETDRAPQVPVPQLAEEAEISESTAHRILNKWEEKALLRRHPVGGEKGKGRQRANRLEPTLPEDEDGGNDFGCTAPARAGPQRKGRGLHRLRLAAV
jgi:DNA-binding MarR family transcriptional regulator